MLTIKKSFKLLHWKLLLAIFATLFIPVLYRTTRIFFIGTIDGSYNFSIAGNLQWINVLFEVLEEAFLLPLFFVLSKLLRLKDSKERNQMIIWQFIMIAIIYMTCIMFFAIFSEEMMRGLSVQHVTPVSIEFVRAEFLSRFFIMVGKIGAILLIAMNKWKRLLFALFLYTTTNIFLDLFISSDNPVSLNRGIMWIAYNQLIATGFLFFVYGFLIWKAYGFKLSHLKPKIFFSLSNNKQNLYSGLESLVRNAFFIWFVITTINRLGQGFNQGDFWVMSSFIWDWLLIPIIAIGQYLNRDQAINKDRYSFKERMAGPFTLIGLIILIWFAVIPSFKPFIQHVLNNDSFELINQLVLISLGFYVLMAFNEPIDKILYGDGRAQYMLIQSIIVNTVVYIPYYYLKESLTIQDVAIMMGTAIAADSLITFLMFWFWFRKRMNMTEEELEATKLKRTLFLKKINALKTKGFEYTKKNQSNLTEKDK